MMVGTICRRGDRQVGRVDIHVKLDMTAARTLSSRHSVVRKASNMRACGGPQSPVSTPRVLPTAPERVCLARATPWTLVDLGGMTSSKRPRRLHGQGRLGRLGVETTRPRAYISQNHLIRSYDGRHGLRRPWEVGRRASASARGRPRATYPLRADMRGKGVNNKNSNSGLTFGFSIPVCCDDPLAVNTI